MDASRTPIEPDARKARRQAGVYYTPESAVRAIVRWTFDGWETQRDSDDGLRVLEPACGQGAFLVEAYRHLLDRKARELGIVELEWADRRELLLSSLFGIDVDAASVQAARRGLATLAAGQDESKVEPLVDELGDNIRCGNALIDDLAQAEGRQRLESFAWRTEFPRVFTGDVPGFDAVIGNPPYVNARLLLQSQGKIVKDYFRRRYRSACGSYDLYVLFIEKAFELLRVGGRCGFIVPNKIAGLEYAREVRRLLAEHCTIHRIVDLADSQVFPDASVYPYVIVWEKRNPPPRHVIRVGHVGTTAPLESFAAMDSTTPWATMAQCRLSADAGWQLHGQMDVESRGPWTPLSEVASLYSGTTGFTASRMADALVEHCEDGDGFDFIVSGNIDRYQIQLGDVRFMKHRYRRPMLPCRTAAISDAKRELFSGSKIVLAGMTKRLEAAWDDQGLALGVQVYAATNFRLDPWYLLAVLNSKLLSYLYWSRFQAKRLAGGYLSVNKSQLSLLPIATDGSDESARSHRLEQLAQLGRRRDLAATGSVEESIEAIDEAIDRLVYSTYRLTDREIQTVESRF